MTYLEKVLEGLSGQSKLRKSTNHSTWTTEKWLCLKNDFKKSDTYLQTVIWIQFVKWVQSLSRVWLFVTSWTAVCRASLSFSECLGACSNSYPLSWWCRPTFLSPPVPFSSCLQSFPVSGYFAMSRLFASSSQNTGVSASASVLPMNI